VKTGRLDSIQMMRGVAAMLVVFIHTGDVVLGRTEKVGHSYILDWAHFDDIGAIGVDLFFVISGFVMALSARKLHGFTGARNFLALRWVRIAPPYLIITAYMVVQNTLTAEAPPWQSVSNAVLMVPVVDGETYTQTPVTVGWTLSFEFTFYLAVAAMIAAGYAKRLDILAGIFVIAAALGAALSPDLLILNWLTNAIFLEFGLGIVACLLWKRGLDTKYRPAWLAAAGLSVVALVVQVFTGYHHVDDWLLTLDGSHSLLRVALWGLPCFFIFVAFLPSERPSQDTIVGRGLRTLGDASYSIYLVHTLVFFFISSALDRISTAPPADVVVVGGMVVVAIVGWAYWRAIELPMTAFLRDRVARRLHSPRHLDPQV
jgi:exopolysaccharide production protein ExoZ